MHGQAERLHFHFSLSCIGEGNGNPLQYSCLENPRDRGAWWAAVYGVAQSRTRLKRLSNSSSTSGTEYRTNIFLISNKGNQLALWIILGAGGSIGCCGYTLAFFFKRNSSYITFIVQFFFFLVKGTHAQISRRFLFAADLQKWPSLLIWAKHYCGHSEWRLWGLRKEIHKLFNL